MTGVEEALLKRILPHSIEAEQSVIGSMIMDREAIVVASEIVLGDDFYNKQYGILFDTMVELNDEGKPVEIYCFSAFLHPLDSFVYRDNRDCLYLCYPLYECCQCKFLSQY